MNLFRKTKKEYFENIIVKNVSDDNNFWETVKPFFTNKGFNTNKLMLIQKNNFILQESALANLMNQDFTSIAKQLNLKSLPNSKTQNA